MQTQCASMVKVPLLHSKVKINALWIIIRNSCFKAPNTSTSYLLYKDKSQTYINLCYCSVSLWIVFMPMFWVVFARHCISTSFHACHWKRNYKNSSQTTGSFVTSLLQLILKYLFQPCKFAQYLPRIRIWLESECEWGGGRGKRSAGCKRESITFSVEPNRGHFMYRLFVPTHVFSPKRSYPIMPCRGCVWSDFGPQKSALPFFWSLLLLLLFVFHSPVCHFVLSLAANGRALSA